MVRPNELRNYKNLELKLGIKSSLPDIKQAIALMIIFYEVSDSPSEIIYSKSSNNGIVLSDELEEFIRKKVIKVSKDVPTVRIEELLKLISNNPLFKAQIEPLVVAFELIWKIAKISFVDERAFSAERTGGNRYPKQITYSSNIDIIHALVSSNDSEYFKILINWLGVDISVNNELEKVLLYLLSALSEGAIYKLREDNLIFGQIGIYEQLINGAEEVDLKEKETVGPLRILKNMLTDQLNPYLSYQKQKSVVSRSVDHNIELENYTKRVNTMLELSALPEGKENLDKVSNQEFEKKIKYQTGYKSTYSRNRIIFGAPGTGKSYKLKEESVGSNHFSDNLLKDGGYYERVTFHPDYSYANFVGTYKPIPVKDSEGNEVITYSYVPGPFMRVLVESLKNSMNSPVKPNLLIIEEINRANVSAVFGEVFQLLDRVDGVSEYPINVTEDMKLYLSTELNIPLKDLGQIKIPDNMFIWATMNSADQGVYPMDTAFKRRWDFTYQSINFGEEKISNYEFELGDSEHKQMINWNKLRKTINTLLSSSSFKVNEDKLIGPYFIPLEKLEKQNSFLETFKGKLIMYLFDDVIKQRRGQFFEGCSNPMIYSLICEEFDRKGIEIFNEYIVKNLGLEHSNALDVISTEEG